MLLDETEPSNYYNGNQVSITGNGECYVHDDNEGDDFVEAKQEVLQSQDNCYPRTPSPYIINKEEPKSWALDPSTNPKKRLPNLNKTSAHGQASHTTNVLCSNKCEPAKGCSQPQCCEEIFVTQHTSNKTSSTEHQPVGHEKSPSHLHKQTARIDDVNSKNRTGVRCVQGFGSEGSAQCATSERTCSMLAREQTQDFENTVKSCEKENNIHQKDTYETCGRQVTYRTSSEKRPEECTSQGLSYARSHLIPTKTEKQPCSGANEFIERRNSIHRMNCCSSSTHDEHMCRPRVLYGTTAEKNSDETLHRKDYTDKERFETQRSGGEKCACSLRDNAIAVDAYSEDYMSRTSNKLKSRTAVQSCAHPDIPLEENSVYRTDYPPKCAKMECSFAPKYEYHRPSIPYSRTTTYLDDYVERRAQKPTSFKPMCTYSKPNVKMENHTCHRDDFKWLENDERDVAYARPRHRPPTVPFEGVTSYNTDFMAKPIKRRNGFFPRDNLTIDHESGIDSCTTYQSDFVPYAEKMQSSFKPRLRYMPPDGQMEKLTSYRMDYRPPNASQSYSENELGSQCASCRDSHNRLHNGRSNRNSNKIQTPFLNQPDNYRRSVNLSELRRGREIREGRSSSVSIRKPAWRSSSCGVSMNRPTQSHAISEHSFANNADNRYARKVFQRDSSEYTNEQMAYYSDSNCWLPPGRSDNSQHIRMKMGGFQTKRSEIGSDTQCPRLPPLPYNKADGTYAGRRFVPETNICPPVVA